MLGTHAGRVRSQQPTFVSRDPAQYSHGIMMDAPRVAEMPGRLVAQALAGAWRENAAQFACSPAQLDSIKRQLLGSGAAGLGWHRVRNTNLRTSPTAVLLQQAYRLQVLHAGLHEIEIEQVIELLGQAGLRPLLIKGRAATEFYPDRALRPYGDIDLCFEPAQYPTAAEVLTGPQGKAFNVDPHNGLDRFYGISTGDLFERSKVLKIGKAEVRVPCFEDHLRILCIHFLKHGAWRPLSLCDVAAALESRPDSVDWDRCLGADKRRQNWVACAIGLAHELLEARLDDIPVTARAARLPGWLIPAVLRQWENPYPEYNETTEFLLAHVKSPSKLRSELGKRWPNPIRATMYFGATFNDFPRLPFQLFSFVTQGARFLARLPQPANKTSPV